MSGRVPDPPERKVIMAECHVCGVSGGLTVSFAGVGMGWVLVGVLSGFRALYENLALPPRPGTQPPGARNSHQATTAPTRNGSRRSALRWVVGASIYGIWMEWEFRKQLKM